MVRLTGAGYVQNMPAVPFGFAAVATVRTL